MKRAVAGLAVVSAVLGTDIPLQASPAGEAVFSKRCAICHVVKGKGAAIGPDLTRVSARLSEKEIREKLANPKKGNPSSNMPVFRNLPGADTEALIVYLKSLK